MMIWLEIWSFVSNFNFDNSFWFWKYPQVTKYSFEICNFSYDLINVLKIDQTIFFFVITIVFLFGKFAGTLRQKFNLTDIWTFENWIFEHLNI